MRRWLLVLAGIAASTIITTFGLTDSTAETQKPSVVVTPSSTTLTAPVPLPPPVEPPTTLPPVPAPVTVPAASPPPPSGDFAAFRDCTIQIESHGDYGAVSPDGVYRGAWQFIQSTFDGAVNRAGFGQYAGTDPAQAPSDIQDAAAAQLYSERGNQPWGGRC